MKKKLFSSPAEALAEGSAMPYAWIRRADSVFLGKNPGLTDMSGILEARFFGPDGEVRLYDDGFGMEAAWLCEEAEDSVIDSTEALLPGFGKSLRKRRILAFDEDGQAYTAAQRLLSWED